MIWSPNIDVWLLWYFEYYRYSYGPDSGKILPWIFVVCTIWITIYCNMDIDLGLNGSFNVVFTIWRSIYYNVDIDLGLNGSFNVVFTSWITIHYDMDIDLGFNGSFKSSDYIFVGVWTELDLGFHGMTTLDSCGIWIQDINLDLVKSICISHFCLQI